YDPERPAKSYETLPPRMLFSRSGTGMAVWKSSWEQNGVTVFFKCGNYFDDHGHFDQGHLDVFHRAPLLIDSGAYLTFDGPFRTEYWHLSVAHNTILIVDPAVAGDEGGQRVFSSQSDDTLEKYLANKKSKTGDIIGYLDDGNLAYVAGDLSAAYSLERAESVIREVAFLDNSFLVVLDRVTTRRPELKPKVLWHCPVYPVTSADRRRFTVDRSGGRVVVTTLLPQPAEIAWIDSFEVGGRKIAPEGKFQAVEGMGVGRFEVGDPREVTDHLFLHVIEITDTPADPNAYEARPEEVSAMVSGGVIVVTAGNRVLRFKADRPGLIR
ncbi:MAG TPA: heparinase II/III family protein, partial [Candidatus Glassbacteria bacterium]|nr:heparinase II/III family protein [Candidatus Glassbacteria bacterium]